MALQAPPLAQLGYPGIQLGGGGQRSSPGGGGNAFGDFLNAYVTDKGNLLNRQSAWERNFLDQENNYLQNATNRYGIDAGRNNLMTQLQSQEGIFRQQDATNRFGLQTDYDKSLFGDLANLAGNRYGADRAAQASLGSAAINAQSNMLAPMLQQQRFMSLAPHVLGALGSLGKGGSNLSNAIMAK